MTSILPTLASPLPLKPKDGLWSIVSVFWSCDRYLTYPVNSLLATKYNNLSFRVDMFNHPHTMFWDVKIGRDGEGERKTVMALICKERGYLRAKVESVDAGGLEEVKKEAVVMERRYGCGYVGVFDYDNLVAFGFDDKVDTSGDPSVMVVEPQDFRNVLYGVLQDVCVKAGSERVG